MDLGTEIPPGIAMCNEPFESDIMVLYILNETLVIQSTLDKGLLTNTQGFHLKRKAYNIGIPF